MEVLQSLLEFFEIESLSSSATFVELLTNFTHIVFAVFIVAFLIRSLFLACTVPFDNWD